MSAPVTLLELADAGLRSAHPGGVAFTPRQLFYEVWRGRRAQDLAEPDIAEFEEALRIAPPPSGLLRGLPLPPLPLAGREPDLAAYGLARILVCQSEEVARMLQENLFHMETGCAVLASPEPGPIPPPFAAMLRRARRPSFFLLYDASPAGLRWQRAWTEHRRWWRGARLRSAGLSPAQARRLGLPALSGKAVEVGAVAAGLAPAERQWLEAGWSAEVAAVAPARLLRALRRIVLGSLPVPAPELAAAGAGYMTWP